MSPFNYPEPSLPTVTRVTDTVAIQVRLRRIGDQRAVVAAHADAVMVYIGAARGDRGQRDRITGVAHTVVVDVPLQRIGSVGAVVVGSVGAPSAIGGGQTRHRTHAITIRVGLGHGATVRVNRRRGCCAGTQITCICDAIVVSIRQVVIDSDATMLRVGQR